MMLLFSHKIFRKEKNHSQAWMYYHAWLFLYSKYLFKIRKSL